MPQLGIARGAPAARGVALDRLAECVRALDPGTRALLDLSLRSGLRDDTLAPLVRTDPFQLAWGRARALEHLAREASDGAPAPVADVRRALLELDAAIWLGQPQLPAPVDLAPQERPDSTARASVELVLRTPASGRIVELTTRREGPSLAQIKPAIPAPVASPLERLAHSAPPLRLAVRGLVLAAAGIAARALLARTRGR